MRDISEKGATMIEYSILSTIAIGVIMMVAYLSLSTGSMAGKDTETDRPVYEIPVLFSSIG